MSRPMNTAKEIEEAIESLTESELEQFRAWYAEFDAQSWDKQFESDVKSGKLSDLAKQAISRHQNNNTKSI